MAYRMAYRYLRGGSDLSSEALGQVLDVVGLALGQAEETESAK